MRQAQYASRWVERNKMLFHTPVTVPWISTACNNSVQQQLVDGRRSVEEIRDDLMFNFTSTADLCDFVSYINEWLNLYISVCFDGDDYLANNVIGPPL